MKRIVLVIGGIFLWKLSILAEPVVGQTYRFSFGDVDGNELSTADGRFNVVVLSSKATSDKARIGDVACQAGVRVFGDLIPYRDARCILEDLPINA